MGLGSSPVTGKLINLTLPLFTYLTLQDLLTDIIGGKLKWVQQNIVKERKFEKTYLD